MRESTNQTARTGGGLVHYLTTGQTIIDATIDKTIVATVDDPEPVTDYLSTLITGANQVTVLATPAVNAHLQHFDEQGLNGSASSAPSTT